MPCSSSAARSSGWSRRARIAAWIRGCSVFTRPPRSSGISVRSSTRVTSRPCSARWSAVPPLATISTPSSASPRANSAEPGLVEGGDQGALDHEISSRTAFGSSRCSTAWTRARSDSTVSSSRTGHGLGDDHRARCRRLRRRSAPSPRSRALRPRARPRSGARPGKSGQRSRVRVHDPLEAARGSTGAAGACSRRRQRGSRPARRASRPSPRPAPPGSRSRRARRPPSECRQPRRARALARSGLFDATAAIGNPSSISACRFVPSPETRTPITRLPRSPDRRPRRSPERPRTSRSRR